MSTTTAGAAPSRDRFLALTAVALMTMSGSSGAASAALDALSSDGLYTWRVPATDEAPAWCCFRWMNDSPIAGVCDLDGRQDGVGLHTDHKRTLDGEVQIYASIRSGKVEHIHALSPDCPVKSKREIRNLGAVEVDESLGWLEAQVQPHTEASSDALAAIAMHLGSAALRYLSELAENAGPLMELRKDAIFWMGQVRIAASAGELERLMFRDRSSEIREHAAFSLAQSEAPHRSAPLIRQGHEDEDPEVRAQAWFWLAQTELPESEDAIQWAVANDRDADVREQAVFALSQLPEERAVDSLFVVLRNRQLPEDVRKQALFWLAQSDSDRAYEYLDGLLTSK
jgi:hypothetical protein